MLLDAALCIIWLNYEIIDFDTTLVWLWYDYDMFGEILGREGFIHSCC
jgi:hypothetical protein